MADSQDIEAKLAAYVDGELPPEQRAEIEKYLSANPQQRRLIADLMRQRDVLRDLPKVNAPTDVAETLNMQLERSVLLDGGERDGVAGTISPWRSIAAVAAVVLLVGALGLTIYSLLPSPSRKPPDLASMQTVPASRPKGESPFATEEAPTSTPVATEQEMRARSALAQRDTPASILPAADQATSIAGGMAAPTAETINTSAPAELTLNAPTTAASIVPPTQSSGFYTARVETIDVATADAGATRRQLASTLTALGGRIEAPATTPAEETDNTLAVEVPPQDMDRAIAVARSFSTALPAAMPMAKAMGNSTTQPVAESNSNNSQLQNIPPVQQALPEMLAIPATQPSHVVTVRISLLLPELPPTTAPSTLPATEPTSNPSTEPTTQP